MGEGHPSPEPEAALVTPKSVDKAYIGTTKGMGWDADGQDSNRHWPLYLKSPV
jgi:hypothetical protein